RLGRMQAQIKPVRPSAGCEGLLGYRYSAALIEQLERLNLNTAPLPRAGRVGLLLASADPTAQQLQKRLDEHGLPTELRLGKEASDWDRAALYTEAALLADGRRAVVDLLGGAAG